MIDHGPLSDLDDSLGALLSRFARQRFPPRQNKPPEGVTFGPPGPSPENKPSVNFFLYDIRENRELRTPEWEPGRTGQGRVRMSRPPIPVDCSYLVTAWDKDDYKGEQLLLGLVMRILLSHPTLPPEVLKGSLVGKSPPVRAIPLQSGHLQGPSDLWQVLKDNPPKPVLHYALTIRVDVPTEPAKAPVPLVLESVVKSAVSEPPSTE